MPASPHPAPATSWHPATTSCLCEPGPGSTPSLPRGFPVGTGEKRSPSPLLSSLLSHPLLSPVPAQKLNSPEPGGSWGSEAAPRLPHPSTLWFGVHVFGHDPKEHFPSGARSKPNLFHVHPDPSKAGKHYARPRGPAGEIFPPRLPQPPAQLPPPLPGRPAKPTRSGCHRPLAPLPLSVPCPWARGDILGGVPAPLPLP